MTTVPPDGWVAPTPCSEWDVAGVVEHVIGFHEFLLLRPLGARAHRPRTGSAARWRATAVAIDEVLGRPGVLDEELEMFDGARRRPRDVLGALTTDVLIHTWDVARSIGVPVTLDAAALDQGSRQLAGASNLSDSGMYAAPVVVDADASLEDRLLALTGRDPAWAPIP